MEKRFNDLANAWAARNGIDIVLTEWHMIDDTGLIAVKNSYIYYDSLKELDEIVEEYGYCLWTIDKADNLDDNRANLNIWIRLE